MPRLGAGLVPWAKTLNPKPKAKAGLGFSTISAAALQTLNPNPKAEAGVEYGESDQCAPRARPEVGSEKQPPARPPALLRMSEPASPATAAIGTEGG